MIYINEYINQFLFDLSRKINDAICIKFRMTIFVRQLIINGINCVKLYGFIISDMHGLSFRNNSVYNLLLFS